MYQYGGFFVPVVVKLQPQLVLHRVGVQFYHPLANKTKALNWRVSYHPIVVYQFNPVIIYAFQGQTVNKAVFGRPGCISACFNGAHRLPVGGIVTAFNIKMAGVALAQRRPNQLCFLSLLLYFKIKPRCRQYHLAAGIGNGVCSGAAAAVGIRDLNRIVTSKFYKGRLQVRRYQPRYVIQGRAGKEASTRGGCP